jgi:hypothetical protein
MDGTSWTGHPNRTTLRQQTIAKVADLLAELQNSGRDATSPSRAVSEVDLDAPLRRLVPAGLRSCRMFRVSVDDDR